MIKIFFSAITVILLCSDFVFSQNLTPVNLFGKRSFNLSNKIYEDTNKVITGKNSVQKVNIGGIFISPNMGLSYPMGTFSSNSGIGFVYGFKLEFALSKLYPFVPGLVFESETFKGAAGFINNNLLTSFSTQIIYLGGSMDIILNKFLKSDFTKAIFTGEIKYATMKREISPDVAIPGIVNNESLLTYSGGLAFTLYIFDLGVKYTYADVYSNLNLQVRIHFPLVRF